MTLIPSRDENTSSHSHPYITKNGNVNTGSIKQEHNSNTERFKNLKTILNDEKIKENLEKRGITYDADGDLVFNIKKSEKEEIKYTIGDIGDFYSMLKKFSQLFLPNKGLTTSNGNPYEISEDDSYESKLFADFLVEYSEGNSIFYTEFEDERINIEEYRSARLQAINDTLSCSGEFISGKNKSALGEQPFYDTIDHDPKSKKKCIILANKCADNPIFLKFINKIISDGNNGTKFFEFIEHFNDDNLDTLAALFKTENFVSVMEGIFKLLPGSNNILDKIKILIKNKEIKGTIINFFDNLNTVGIKNTITFLNYSGENWGLFFKDKKSLVIIELLNSQNNFGKEFAYILSEIGILSIDMINKIIQGSSNNLMIDIYNYVQEKEKNDIKDFIKILGFVFLHITNLEYIKFWLEENDTGVNIQLKLATIKEKPKHVIEKLNKGINPIPASRTIIQLLGFLSKYRQL